MRFQAPSFWRVAGLALLLAGALLNAALAGDVGGTVTIRSKLHPRASGKGGGSTGSEPFGYSDSGDEAPRPLSSAQEVPFVVVSVVSSTLPATPRTLVMRQKGREFSPHVLVAPRGSTVVFTNEDPFFHSIYSESTAGRFSLPKYPRGKKESRTFSTPGPIELFCGIHSRMNAYIYITENDFFTQPAADGRFSLKGIPAGTYTLRFWHPRGALQTQRVTVPASGAVNVNVAL